MSNVALFNPSQAPAFAKNRKELSPIAKALAGGAVGGGGKRISIKGGVFRLNDGGKEIAAIEDRYLDVVVVNAAPDVSRVFYAKSYDGEASAPDCWSQDGKTPSPDAGNPQHHKCDGCPKNIAGSGQGNSRACRYQQRVAVVLANDMEGAVMQITLPATSIFGKEDGENRPLQAYARYLAAQNIDPSEVITRMKFDTKSESPKLFFKAMRWLTDDEFPIIQQQGKTDAAIKAITMTVAKMDNVSAPAPLKLEGKRPSAAPAPEPEEEAPAPKAKKAKPAPLPAEDDEEPVVRKEEKKPNAVPKAKSALADMVDDWDENE
jgi:hypothetical protein